MAETTVAKPWGLLPGGGAAEAETLPDEPWPPWRCRTTAQEVVSCGGASDGCVSVGGMRVGGVSMGVADLRTGGGAETGADLGERSIGVRGRTGGAKDCCACGIILCGGGSTPAPLPPLERDGPAMAGSRAPADNIAHARRARRAVSYPSGGPAGR